MPEPKRQSMTDSFAQFIPTLLTTSRRAGECIMGHYETAVAVDKKEDSSPVTAADIEANTLIVKALLSMAPQIPVVAEESDNATHIAEIPPLFWLVDPLDGTKSFIKRTGEFTVNIGLIQNRRPVMGVVYIPAKDEMYFTGEKGGAYFAKGSEKPQRIEVRTPPKDGMVVVASASHRTPETDEYISTLKVKSFLPVSSSLKFCAIAKGEADIYPRFGPTMEWDTAAGQAVLEAAGGTVHTLEGAPFIYGKESFRNGYFIARGKSV